MAHHCRSISYVFEMSRKNLLRLPVVGLGPQQWQWVQMKDPVNGMQTGNEAPGLEREQDGSVLRILQCFSLQCSYVV